MSPDQESPGAEVKMSELEWDKATVWCRAGVQEEEGRVGLAHVGAKHQRSRATMSTVCTKIWRAKKLSVSSWSHTNNGPITECPEPVKLYSFSHWTLTIRLWNKPHSLHSYEETRVPESSAKGHAKWAKISLSYQGFPYPFQLHREPASFGLVPGFLEYLYGDR